MTRLTLIPSKMLVLLSLFITGVHANEEQALIKDTPFVSGQAFKKGFFWYDDPTRKTEEEITETKPPVASSTQPVDKQIFFPGFDQTIKIFTDVIRWVGKDQIDAFSR